MIKLQEFMRVGHWPTLLAAFLYFDASFMAWAVLGPLSLYLGRDLGLSIEEKFGIAAAPILAGALLRIPLGMAADRFGPKRTGALAQIAVIAALSYAWLCGLHSKLAALALGAVLGVAGASFAVALPQASRWYPPRFQGAVMGIAGAGNMGAVLDALFVPWLAERIGWQAVFGALLIPLAMVLCLYLLLAKDAPPRRAPAGPAHYARILRDRDAWWFMFFYSITFGGFAGLGGALPLYFSDWDHASGVAAGLMAGAAVLAGSMARPVGGALADRFGGIRILQMLFGVVALTYGAAALLPQAPAPQALAGAEAAGWTPGELPGAAWCAAGVFFIGAAALGMGNGSVFQLVALRFRDEIGAVTGLVGAAGGLGGFLLAEALGAVRGATGGFMAGFAIFAALALIGLCGLMKVKTRWRGTWGTVAGARV